MQIRVVVLRRQHRQILATVKAYTRGLKRHRLASLFLCPWTFWTIRLRPSVKEYYCVRFKSFRSGFSLHCANNNNQETEHVQMQANVTQKVALINSGKHTQKPMLRDRTDRSCFSRLLRHPARKQNGSGLSTLEPARVRTKRKADGADLAVNQSTEHWRHMVTGP